MTLTRDPETIAPEIALDLQNELIKHPGKWAAMTRTELIALADTAQEAYRLARQQGTETPILYHVPDSRSGYSYY
jgi:Family of unknown function (DUF5678)